MSQPLVHYHSNGRPMCCPGVNHSVNLGQTQTDGHVRPTTCLFWDIEHDTTVDLDV